MTGNASGTIGNQFAISMVSPENLPDVSLQRLTVGYTGTLSPTRTST